MKYYRLAIAGHLLLERLQHLAGAVVPARCAVCGRPLGNAEPLLCLHCRLRMPRPNLHRLPRTRLSDMLTRLQPATPVAAMFAYRHDSPYSALVRNAKFGNSPHTGFLAGREFGRQLLADGFFDGVDAIVPVPLSALRLVKRGYNQAYQIASGMSAATGVPVRCLLKAPARHAAQVGQNRSRRLASASPTRFAVRHNLAKRFGDSPGSSLAGKRLVVVDDVVTTGATVVSAVAALRAAFPALAPVAVAALATTEL